jgi:uncharacterized membrane protein YvbJ
MVYCTKCGALNADDAKVCVQCGAPLYGAKEESSPYWRHKYMRHEEDYRYWKRRGAIATLILGLIIIFIGFLYLLEAVYHMPIPLVADYPNSPWHLHPCAWYYEDPQIQAISPFFFVKTIEH